MNRKHLVAAACTGWLAVTAFSPGRHGHHGVFVVSLTATIAAAAWVARHHLASAEARS